MAKAVSFDDLVEIMRRRGAAGRSLTAIAGAPGAGKSSLAEKLVARLNDQISESAAVLGMDGYHLDDLILVPRGLRARKGAPETFDVDGLRHMLGRLRRDEEVRIAVPVFDRSLEIARAGARLIPHSIRHLVVEGNYLLLDRRPWSDLLPFFDTTVMIVVPETILRERLMQRWQGYGLSPGEIAVKLDENDLPNGRVVTAGSVASEFVIGDAW
jgi:pantothenate kinase